MLLRRSWTLAVALAAASCTVALSSTVDAAASFTGKWNFVGTMQTGTVHTNMTTVCSLQQSGSRVTGSCAGSNGAGPANGAVTGNTIQLQVHAIPPSGFLSVLTFRGALAGTTQVRGTWTSSTQPKGSGTFNAVRS